MTETETPVAVGKAAYLRWDRLHALLKQELGDKATRPQMAAHLGVPYLTLWRLSAAPKAGQPRYRANDRVIAAVRAAFPAQSFDDLFEVGDEEPRKSTRGAVKPEPVEELYTVAELAQRWKCSTDHIYTLISKRQLDSVDIGIGRAKTRITASAVTAYLDKKRAKSPASSAA